MRMKYEKDMSENKQLIDRLRLQLEDAHSYRFQGVKDSRVDHEREFTNKLARIEPLREVIYKKDPAIELELERLIEDNKRYQGEVSGLQLKLTEREEEIGR